MTNVESKTHELLNTTLSQQRLSSVIVISSLFLTAYELLRAAVVDDIRSFFTILDDQNRAGEKRYRERLRQYDKRDAFKGSCLWLCDWGAIDEAEVTELLQLRSIRNRLAHELPQILFKSGAEVTREEFQAVQRLLAKVCRFWVRQDLELDPEFEGQTIADEEIVPGRLAAFAFILSMLAQNEPQHEQAP